MQNTLPFQVYGNHVLCNTLYYKLKCRPNEAFSGFITVFHRCILVIICAIRGINT